MISFTFETQRPVYQMSVTWCFVLLAAICCCIGVPLNKIPKKADPLRSASDSSTTPDTTKQLEMTTVHLGSLLDAGHGAVVTLVVGNTRLAAHRDVLEAGSPVTSDTATADSTASSTAAPATTTAETRPHSDQRQTAATAGRHTLPPDAAAVYHLPASATAGNATTSTAATTATPAIADSTSTSTAASPAAPMGCLNTQLPDAHAVSSFRNLSAEQKGRRLLEAADKGAEQEVRALLSVGAEVGTRDRDDWTALHWAARSGHVGVAQCLLRAGAQVDARSTWQATPLHMAAANGRTAVARLLLASSAEVGARDEGAWTPLHWAAFYGQLEAVAALIEAGADRGATDNRGRTPLDLARERNHHELKQMLQSRLCSETSVK